MVDGVVLQWTVQASGGWREWVDVRGWLCGSVFVPVAVWLLIVYGRSFVSLTPCVGRERSVAS